MSDEERDSLCRNLALLNVVQHLNNEYKGEVLSPGQLYTLYQKFYDADQFKDIVGLGISEDLP